MNQNFDDRGGAERNLSDGPGRSGETCCKQFEARETDDRPGDFPEGGSVEDTLPLSSQFSEVERLAALKSGTAQFNYRGSEFDWLWQDWIDNKDWDSMSQLFMEGAAGLSLTFLSGVDQIIIGWVGSVASARLKKAHRVCCVPMRRRILGTQPKHTRIIRRLRTPEER